MPSPSFLLYQQRETWLDRSDPRMKILGVLLIGAALLLNHHIYFKSAQLITLIVLWRVAKLSWRMLTITILSLTIFFISTMIYQAMLIPDPSQAMIHFLGMSLSKPGMLRGIMMCEQIAGVVLLLSLLVRTTSPVILAEGLEKLLQPLKKIKLPVHEGVMMFSIALRFLPILVEEFDKIRKAQMARGGGFHRKGVRSRFRGVLPMLMPLFVMSIIRAKDLAVAMESRCYRGDVGRTPIRLYKFDGRDYGGLAFSMLNLLLVFVL